MNVYKTVAVRLNTHDAGGKVTALDVELARRLEKVGGGLLLTPRLPEPKPAVESFFEWPCDQTASIFNQFSVYPDDTGPSVDDVVVVKEYSHAGRRLQFFEAFLVEDVVAIIV